MPDPKAIPRLNHADFPLRILPNVGTIMQRKNTLEPSTKRAVRRCSFVASVEVTDITSGTKLSARTSEIGMGGCYVDVLNPFPLGTQLNLRILRDQGVLSAKAKVAYCDQKFGMGVAFTEIASKDKALLETWLAEIVILLKPVS